MRILLKGSATKALSREKGSLRDDRTLAGHFTFILLQSVGFP